MLYLEVLACWTGDTVFCLKDASRVGVGLFRFVDIEVLAWLCWWSEEIRVAKGIPDLSGMS